MRTDSTDSAQKIRQTANLALTRRAAFAGSAALMLAIVLFASLANAQVLGAPPDNGNTGAGSGSPYGALPQILPSVYGNSIDATSPDQNTQTAASGRTRAKKSPADLNAETANSSDQTIFPVDEAGAAATSSRIIDIFEQRPELIDPIKRSVEARLTSAGMNERAQELQQDSTEDGFYRKIQDDADIRVMVVQELRRRGYSDFGGTDYSGLDLAPGSKKTSLERAAQTDQSAASTEDASSDQTPKLVTRRSPYPSLPSLRDLYTQFAETDPKLKRFGSNIFKSGTGNSDQLPMDLPAGPDYVVGPGDELVVSLSGSVSLRLQRVIDRQGQIALPETASIVVAGMTLEHARDAIQKALATQFRKVNVDLSLARLRTVRIYVVGDVQRPGAYDISSLSSPLNALYAAGGPTSRGSLRVLHQYRGKALVRDIDLYDFMLRGVSSDSGRLQSGDTLLVPPVGPQVAVSGMVRRPAIYELKDEEELGQVLDLAGGVLVSAAMRQINVERIEAHSHRAMLSVNVPEGRDQGAIAKALSSFAVQDGDRVTVQPILPYAEKAVYLQGHVFRPGKYSYHDGETVNDLLRSYQDLLPEPADHAEIVRLEPPDLHPVTISFKLSDILIGDDPIELKPFDVIRIYSRYEADPPKVYVYGQVLRPGEYPLAQGMTAAGLVQMAGGFNRSAFRGEADLSSYVVQDGKRILVKHGAVDIAKAVDGNKNADIPLKPGDVITIRQLTGWNDIGASVNVKGEVMYAGKYGIQEGERLSSVLKRAGGFRSTAYPAGAVLERVQVRELAEKTRDQLIRRIQTESMNVKTGGNTTGSEVMAFSEAMHAQEQNAIASLKSTPPSGRLVIKIGPDISKWENTPADVEMRAGDVLVVPKQPTFVIVSGQVYNPAAISFLPGKNAEYYLKQAGGPTQLANKKSIFIVRADGSVIGQSSGGFWSGGVMGARLQPGDSLVVPDKIIGGSVMWKNLLTVAQLASSAAVTASIATHF